VSGVRGVNVQVLVANGGLGSAFDELDLNRVMCEANGVKLRGVIINKVNSETSLPFYEQIRRRPLSPLTPRPVELLS
jgi:hypothetical protein